MPAARAVCLPQAVPVVIPSVMEAESLTPAE